MLLSDEIEAAKLNSVSQIQLQQWRDKARKLEKSLLDAIDWNWLDDDYPKDIKAKYFDLATK